MPWITLNIIEMYLVIKARSYSTRGKKCLQKCDKKKKKKGEKKLFSQLIRAIKQSLRVKYAFVWNKRKEKCSKTIDQTRWISENLILNDIL